MPGTARSCAAVAGRALEIAVSVLLSKTMYAGLPSASRTRAVCSALHSGTSAASAASFATSVFARFAEEADAPPPPPPDHAAFARRRREPGRRRAGASSRLPRLPTLVRCTSAGGCDGGGDAPAPPGPSPTPRPSRSPPTPTCRQCHREQQRRRRLAPPSASMSSRGARGGRRPSPPAARAHSRPSASADAARSSDDASFSSWCFSTPTSAGPPSAPSEAASLMRSARLTWAIVSSGWARSGGVCASSEAVRVASSFPRDAATRSVVLIT